MTIGLWLVLAGCGPDVRDAMSGLRDGMSYDVDIAEAKFGIVGYMGYSPHSLLVVHATSTTTSCDELSFDWPVDTDPRVPAVRLPTRRGSDDLLLVAGNSDGTKWGAFRGGGNNPGPSIIRPNLPVGTSTAAAAGVSWRDADCVGGEWYAESGSFYVDAIMDSTSSADMFATDPWPYNVEMGDTMRFSVQMQFQDANDTVDAQFDAAFCGAWMIADRDVIERGNDCATP